MARSIWKGAIAFGLVNIPVGLTNHQPTDWEHNKPQIITVKLLRSLGVISQ